jgi:4-amino-4-deoxy-L-arabinose transferase-like glycosyltransferase
MSDRTALLVLALACAVRLAVVAAASGVGLEIQDERHYYALADNVLHGRGFALEGGQLTSLRPPLYPTFVAGVWSIAGSQSLTAVRLSSVFLSLGICVLTYHLGLALFNAGVARWALAGVAFYPSLLFADMLLLTEVLFTFLMLAAAVAWVSLLTTPRFTVAWAVGALVAAAALTRSVLWPFPLLLVPMTAWAVRGPVSKKLAVAAMLLVGYVVVMAPWAVRNTRLQGTFTLVDTMGGMNLRMGNYKDTPDDRMWAVVGLTGEKEWSYELHQERSDSRLMTEGQKEKWARNKAIEYMVQHPLVTLRRSAIRFADFWGLEREFVAGVRNGAYRVPVWMTVLVAIVIGVTYPATMVLAAVGAFVTPPKDVRGHVFLMSIVVVICGLHSLVFGHSRYHLPLVPILALYAAAAITNRSFALTRLRTKAAWLPVFATVSILCVIWTRQILVADAARLGQLLNVLQ